MNGTPHDEITASLHALKNALPDGTEIKGCCPIWKVPPPMKRRKTAVLVGPDRRVSDEDGGKRPFVH